jgi:hypothetical protein
VALNNYLPNSGATYADRALYWHGTGRYQYRGETTIDVLQSIADKGQILPNYDTFDITRPMDSVSLARARIYGRAYADMHGRGANEQERYGNSLFWACAFLGSVAVEACKETKVWSPKGYGLMISHLRETSAVDWYKKITRALEPSVIYAYGNGSDIDNNYPMLFGVKAIETTEVSQTVSLHEVRSEQPLDISSDITHVEVPRDKIDETKRVLGGVAIRAIEDGERIAAQYTFSEHMHAIV